MSRHPKRILRRAVNLLRRSLGEPDVAPAVPRAPTSEELNVQALLRSGLLDVEYYEIQAGISFADARAAADHFVRVGMRTECAPHPLIEPEYFPREIREAFRAGNWRAFYKNLTNGRLADRDWGPLFDPRAVPEETGPVEFLRQLSDNSEVRPSFRSAPAMVRYGSVREEILDATRTYREHQRLKAPHVFTTWDDSAEAAWLSRLDGVELKPVRNAPLVSIVMPAWNRATVIGSAIESVQAQTLVNWELLVVDDGSTDETREVVQAIAALDTRVKLVSSAHVGVCAARNLGLSLATADKVAFLDSDNAWRPGFLRAALGAMEADGLRAAYAAARRFTDQDEPTYYGTPVSHAQLLLRNYIDLNTFVADRDLILEVGGFEPSLRRWVDHDLFIRVSALHEIAYLPFIGCDYEHSGLTERISNKESLNWQYAVLERNMVDWDELVNASRTPGKVSVILVVSDGHAQAVTAIKSLLDRMGDSDLEIIVQLNGARRAVCTVLTAAFARNHRVHIRQLPMNYGFEVAANVAFAESTGEYVYFLSADAYVREGWLKPLIGALESGAAAAQSLLVYGDGTVQSAGTLLTSDGYPLQFLNGHPLADALRHGGKDLHALSGAALFLRADQFAALRGFDALYVNGYDDIDISLRLAQKTGAPLVVSSESVAVHRDSVIRGRYNRELENHLRFRTKWPDLSIDLSLADHYARLGLTVPHLRASETGRLDMRAVLVRPPKFIDTTPQLRWAIKIGANFSVGGDRWGDVPFANDLARALNSLGQEVVIDRHLPQSRPTAYLDDVVLVIRGAHAVSPQPGALNILWVISRPETVTPSEVRSFDFVFAASDKWAAHMSAVSGREVVPLLQATDPRRFHFEDQRGEHSHAALFVGGARPPIGRKVVVDAVAAGVDVRVWGPNWPDYLDEHHVLGEYVHNDQLADEYRSAKVVLSDHFDDMAEWGFMNNRLFDAVATGARVISEPVDGIERVFQGAVQTYSSIEELARRVNSVPEVFPNDENMARIARLIASEHSFERRAQTLLEVCLSARN